MRGQKTSDFRFQKIRKAPIEKILEGKPVNARNPLDHDGREGVFYINKREFVIILYIFYLYLKLVSILLLLQLKLYNNLTNYN